MYTFVTNNFPTEVAPAAFFSAINPNVFKSLILNHRDSSVDADYINLSVPLGTTTLIFIGTYWNKHLDKLSKLLSNTNIVIYSPEKTSMIDGYININCEGPFQSCVEFVRRTPHMINAYNMLVQMYQRVIDLVDVRATNQQNEPIECQCLFTGLLNLEENFDKNIYECFVGLFTGKYTLDKVLETGKMTIASQLKLVHERVLGNSKSVAIDDKEVVFTESPDLVNLSHAELYAKYPKAVATVTLNIRLGNTGDKLGVSIRSRDTSVNAKKLVTGYGGGDDKAAGGLIEVDLKYEDILRQNWNL